MGSPPTLSLNSRAVDDPYDCQRIRTVAFSPPLPTTNLKFLGAVMGWTGDGSWANNTFDLSNQANNATLGHAQKACR
jgi:hypothetical protein